MSDDLPRWAAAERLFDVVLRVRITGATELDRYKIVLNNETMLLDTNAADGQHRCVLAASETDTATLIIVAPFVDYSQHLCVRSHPWNANADRTLT